MDTRKRILIVGGVAGGASCAARARRLCEHSEIVVFDRGPYVSFANCGLPYYVGDVIKNEGDLLVATPDRFRGYFNIDVRTEHEITRIDRNEKRVEVLDLRTGEAHLEPYDALVLSTGAVPIRPPIPGIELPAVHVIRTIPDSRKIREAAAGAKRAVIVGAGFIGLEMAENLSARGLDVTMIEMADQVMAPLDPEMAAFVEAHLRAHGVSLVLGESVASLEEMSGGGVRVTTSAGQSYEADVVILGIGVRPETTLARAAGLTIGECGGIAVDEQMRTNDPSIWAVGDAVEARNVVTGRRQTVALAGPANRQGRIAASDVVSALNVDDCTRPKRTSFRGVQSTSVCGVFGMTVAATGVNENVLRSCGIAYEKVYLHPGNHVGYYPGAKRIHIKLLFSTDDGRVLGAQAVGEHDVARRIDVVAIAIQMRATVFDLEEAELCYAPQYGAAKDPINIAGMIAANHLRGDLPLANWDEVLSTDAHIIDVRHEDEFGDGTLPRAINLPLEEMRSRLDELPRDREVWLVCNVGQRAYYATRALMQNGVTVKNLSGGMRTWNAIQKRPDLAD